MNTYKPHESPSRIKFTDGTVLALLLAVCLVQIGACYTSATQTVKQPEVASAVLGLPNGTEVAHNSGSPTNSARAVVAPIRDSRG